jgi:dolichol kinase
MAPALRRSLHAATATLALLWLVSPTVLRLGTLAVAVAALAFEGARLTVPRFNRWIATRLPVFRPQEASRLSGAAWLAVGYAVAAWLPAPGPVAGILAGALADPAAAWVGGRWGRGRRKSWPGTAAAGVVAAIAAAVAGLAVPGALVAGMVGAALERWAGPFDDNLLLAPGVAGVAALLA